MRNLTYLLLVFAIALALTGCAPHEAEHTDDHVEDHHVSSLRGNQTILDEISRLGSLASQKTLTLEEFSAIEQMTHDDEDAADEVGEVETMVKYGEFDHALHGLGFLGSYVETGAHVMCPGHALSHYYVFMRHGETELADESLEEAKENIDAWIPLAKAYDKQYPSGNNIDDVIARVEGDIKNIDAGNTTAGDDEIMFLVTDALCIEGAPHD